MAQDSRLPATVAAATTSEFRNSRTNVTPATPCQARA